MKIIGNNKKEMIKVTRDLWRNINVNINDYVYEDYSKIMEKHTCYSSISILADLSLQELKLFYIDLLNL